MGNKRLLRLVKILAGVQTDAEIELSRLERFAHFWVLVGRSFVRNRCPVRAAALSYTTLLALIPLLAVAIGVTSSLLKSQGEDKIYGAIDQFVSTVVPPGSLGTNGPTASATTTNLIVTAVTNAVTSADGTGSVTNAPSTSAPVVSVSAQKATAKWIHEFVENTRSKTLGVIGMLVLVSIAIRMLASIEATFNDIWGVTRGRNWLWRIVLYWTTITLGPVLIAGALGLAGGSQLQSARNVVERMPFFGELIFKFLPLAMLCLVFALTYLLVPNTKVKFSAALVGGLVGGSLWHLNNIFGFLYVSRVVTNSKIYGSLALLPVFMVGLYFSWVILLFGAQVTYAYQNRKSYLQEKLVESVNQRGKEFIALRLMTLIGQRFHHGEPAASLQQICAGLGIPGKLAQQVLQPLLAARLISEIAGAEPAYLPARPLDAINAHHILRAVRAGAGQDIATRDEPARAEVLGEFARIEEAERNAASSVTLLSLASRAQKQIGDSGTKAK